MWFENSTGVVKTMNFHYKMMDRTHTFTSPYFSDITENDKHEKKIIVLKNGKERL